MVVLADNHNMYSDESEAESASDTEECYDEVPTRVVTTVPAKEPRLDQKPVKSALKKARAKNGKHSSIKCNNKNYIILMVMSVHCLPQVQGRRPPRTGEDTAPARPRTNTRDPGLTAVSTCKTDYLTSL